MIAVSGGLKHLVSPDRAVLSDPIYGYSSHSQFHFSLAAGFFLWAAVMSIIYRGSKVSIAHHVLCFAVYFLALNPFMHHVGNIYLLFQASTLCLDLKSLAKLVVDDKKLVHNLQKLHPYVFVSTRILIGLPISAIFLYDMGRLLLFGTPHSVGIVLFYVCVCVFINCLNVYIAMGMCLGLNDGGKFCTVPHKKGDGVRREKNDIFNLKFSISFGDRNHDHKKQYGSKTHFSDGLFPSLPLIVISVIASISTSPSSLEKQENSIDHALYDNLGNNIYYMLTENETFRAAALVTAILYGAIKIFERYGHLVYTEATPPVKQKDVVKRHLYTKIRNEWYDLARFEHPGGPVALNLARNRDATAMFESHHYLIDHKKLMGVLNKYKVPEAEAANLRTFDPRDDGAHFVWKDYEKDPFVTEVKQMVVDHFTPIAKARGISLREATKATTQKWMLVIGMMVAFFSTVPFFVAGQWWTIVVTPLLAWVIIANYWHDCLHFSMSSDWRVNAIFPYLFPWLSSPWMWYHQHDIGHHAYTNIGHKDPDLAHAPQLKREHESIRWRKRHEKQESWLVFGFIWSLAVGFGLQFMSDIRANLKGRYNNVVGYEKLNPVRMFCHLVGRGVWAYCVFIWPYMVFNFWKAAAFATIPSFIFSWCFMLNSQINHLTEHTAHASDPNFLKHQIVTAQDFGAQNWWCTFFSGGLNMQLEHHCFPCVNHCHLTALQPKLKAICLKHGVNYWEVDGYRSALESHLKHTEKMGVRPFSDDH